MMFWHDSASHLTALALSAAALSLVKPASWRVKSKGELGPLTRLKRETVMWGRLQGLRRVG
jgi:hypothetical protein